METRQISASDTLNLRSLMLRPGKTLSECAFQGDDDDQTFHLGAFVEGRLVSVASFFYQKHPLFTEEHQYRLRGMATLPEFQRSGLSRELLQMAFPMIKQNLCHLVWCNARKSAVGYYEKVGFKKIGDEFEVTDIGPHFLMYKKL